MNGKSLFVIFATITLAWALWSGSLAATFEKIGNSNPPAFLKIDKNMSHDGRFSRSFRHTSEALSRLRNAIFEDIGSSELVHRCKTEPVFFGSILIVLGVSACGLFFLIHMIRTDSRFS